MICTCIQHKSLDEIRGILADPAVEMAEIRLDRCELSHEEIEELFSDSDTPLIATCRIAESPTPAAAWDKLSAAIEAGARFADLEIDAPADISRKFQKLCRECGTEIIRSFHDASGTPDDEGLQMTLARCFRYGADIAKIVTRCKNGKDVSRLNSLYSIVLEDVDTLQGRLIAFALGEVGQQTRLECIRRGAPFTYASLNDDDRTAEGQKTNAEMQRELYGTMTGFCKKRLTVPASKSFAQRAIIAAALAEGTSHLCGYTPCGDCEAAVGVAEALGAKVTRKDDTLAVTGIGPINGKLGIDRLDVGESGLLARLMIPISAAICADGVTLEGRGTLPNRPLTDASEIMAAFGVIAKERSVPVKVHGSLIPGTAEISGQSGSQLISGLLMALPLCDKDSTLFVGEPKSIPYMYITLDVLRHFGIKTRSEMEGDAEMLEEKDWSSCSGISFSIRGGQRYKAADFSIEGDWSAAANYLVAGAIFGSAEIVGLDMKSIQADLSIIDILVEAGAVVSQLDDDTVCVHKAPLEAFDTDLNNAPDLFPIVCVLAAFCSGESSIAGVGRLSGKESDRAAGVMRMLEQMGVEASLEGDRIVICGEPLGSRLINGRLLKGGNYTSRHDHRMAMALKVASLGAESPIVIDDEACISKSFPSREEFAI